MHNLDTNFRKILPICKDLLKDYLLEDNNVRFYPNPSKMSDLEVITISVMAEYTSISSENWLFNKLETDYKTEFPHLISRPRFNIRRRRLTDYINEISVQLAGKLSAPNEALIIDSAPLPICENSRRFRAKVCKEDMEVQPSSAYCASHKKWYYGFKLQLVITEKGFPVASGIYSAKCHDVHALNQIATVQKTDCELLGDKGYISSNMQLALWEEQRIKLVTPLKSNMTGPSNWDNTKRYKRKRVETTLSQLLDQFNLRKNYAKKLSGLLARVVTKIAAISVAQMINHINQKPINHLKYALAF